MVLKKNDIWRVCIDFNDLNESCLKDCFSIPRIDQIVDATMGHKLLTFMDAYSGYNQIPMYPLDSEKTTFITHNGIYCYNVIPFGLKNAEAIYQRMVSWVFEPLIESAMEVYVDNMFVKSKERIEHMQYLDEAFHLI